MFQCVVITVGSRGFETQAGYDFVTFLDSDNHDEGTGGSPERSGTEPECGATYHFKSGEN